MRTLQLPLSTALVVALVFAVTARGEPPDLLWLEHESIFEAGGCGGTYEARWVDVVADAVGGAFVTGLFSGTLDLSGHQVTSAGDFDAFFAHYDSDGNPQWILRGGGASTGITQCENGIAAAVAPNGDVVCVGQFWGAATFDTVAVPNAGQFDAFIARLSAAGEMIWVETIGGAYADMARGVAVDASGYAFVTGITSPSSFAPRAFLTRYDDAGNQLWYWESTQESFGFGAGVDGDGNCTFTGHGTLTLPDSTVSDSGGFFAARCAPDGSFLWAFQDGNLASSADIGVDADGAFYVTGEFLGSTTIGDTTVTSTSLFYPVGYVARYGADRSFQWLRVLDAAGIFDFVSPSRIVVGPNGECIVSGFFEGGMSVGDTTLVNLPPFNTPDAFATTFAASGDFAWAIGVNGNHGDNGHSVSATPGGDLLFAGTFGDSAWFGDSLVVAEGNGEYFLGKYGDVPSHVSNRASSLARARLGQPVPNPFNPTVTIPFTLDRSTPVRIDVFDVRGKLVRALLATERSRGTHDVVWDGIRGDGESAVSGVYFVRLQAAGLVDTRKIVLVK